MDQLGPYTFTHVHTLILVFYAMSMPSFGVVICTESIKRLAMFYLYSSNPILFKTGNSPRLSCTVKNQRTHHDIVFGAKLPFLVQ
jgi:hypothetical protein